MRRLRISTAGAVGLAMLMLAPATGFAASEPPQTGGEPVGQSAPEGVRVAQMGGGAGMTAPGQGFAPGPCQGYGGGYGMGPGMMMGQGTGPGMMGAGPMGPGTMAPGQGYGPGAGTMGQGTGPGMMAPGQGYGPGSGMMAPGYGYGPQPGYGYGPQPGYGYGMGPGQAGPGMMAPGQGYGPGPGMMAPGYGYGAQPGYGMGPAAAPDQDLSVDDVRARLERSLAWNGNARLTVGDVAETDADSITADITTKDGSLVQRFMVDRHSGAMRMAQ